MVADYAIAVWIGIKAKWLTRCGGKPKQHGHWLQPAEERFNKRFIADIKIANGVLYLFLPLPIFWTLFDQSGSRWTLQATMMNTFSMGALGDFQPDMMQSLNAGLILVLIPVFQRFVYPTSRRLGFKCLPLNKMVLGMILCGVSFVLAGVVQIAIESSRSFPTSSLGLEDAKIKLINNLGDAQLGAQISCGADPIQNVTTNGLEASEYVPVSAGECEFSFVFNKTEMLTRTANVTSGVYTAILYYSSDGLDWMLYQDDFGPSKENRADAATVKIIHASSEWEAIDITSDTDDDFTARLDQYDATQRFLPITAGAQKLIIKPVIAANATDNITLATVEFDFRAGASHYIIITNDDTDGEESLKLDSYRVASGYDVSTAPRV